MSMTSKRRREEAKGQDLVPRSPAAMKVSVKDASIGDRRAGNQRNQIERRTQNHKPTLRKKQRLPRQVRLLLEKVIAGEGLVGALQRWLGRRRGPRHRGLGI